MDDMSHERELNLRTHRESANVWDRRGWSGGGGTRIAITRLLLGTAGAAMAIQGLRQSSRTGRVIASMGSALAFWALSNRTGDMEHVRRWCTQLVSRYRGAGDFVIDDASADSFPASDAPAWTPTVGTGLRRAPAGR